MNGVRSLVTEAEAMKLIREGRYEEALRMLLKALETKDYLSRDNVLSNIAVCYLKLDKVLEAVPYLKEALELDNTNEDARYNLAYSYYSLGRYQEAVPILEELLNNEGGRVDLLYHLGFSYLRMGNLLQALGHFRALLSGSPDPALVYNVGIGLIEARYPDTAREFLVDYLSRYPGDIDATFGLGIAYGNLNEHRKAIECLKRVVEWDPARYPAAWTSLGMAYYQIGEIADSLEYLEKSVRIKPEAYDTWYTLGLVLEAASQTDRAIAAYAESGKRNPSFADAWERLAALFLREGKTDEARISYKKAYILTGKSLYAYKQGVILMTQGRYDEAAGLFKECLKDPSLSDLEQNLAFCLYNTGRWDDACRYADAAYTKGHRTETVFFLLGSSLLKLGQETRAQAILDEGLSRYAGDMNLLYTRGLLDASAGRFENASAYFRKALTVYRNPDVLYALGLSSMKSGNNTEAASSFCEYLDHIQNDITLLYKTALLLLQVEERAGARRALEMVLKLEPGHGKAREYLSLLQNQADGALR